MRLSLLTGLSLAFLAGCQSLADQEALRPLPEAGPKPTYTELLTCLELRQDARRLREEDEEKQEGTTRASPRRR